MLKMETAAVGAATVSEDFIEAQQLDTPQSNRLVGFVQANLDPNPSTLAARHLERHHRLRPRMARALASLAGFEAQE